MRADGLAEGAEGAEGGGRSARMDEAGRDRAAVGGEAERALVLGDGAGRGAGGGWQPSSRKGTALRGITLRRWRGSEWCADTLCGFMRSIV